MTDRKPQTVLLFFLCFQFMGCGSQPSKIALDTDTKPAIKSTSTLSPKVIANIEKFCGDCHPLPLPSTFPKANWPEEVRQGFDFYIESMRTDLDEPIRQDVVRYYQDAAPDKVVVPRADQMKVERSSVLFQKGPGIGPTESEPATAHLVWNSSQKSLYFTDMRAGTLREWTPPIEALFTANSPGNDRLISTGRNICRVTLCDWNQDGIQDYLLGELGSFPVGDHELGRVSLLLGKPDGSVESILLAQNLGRVVEAKPFDYDDDGDTDVLVADFGWRKTGALRLLRNVGGTTVNPKMEVETLDARHGAVGVEVADLDGDSKLDFVVAFGQEFESVEVYTNRGAGKFEHKIIMSLPDPSYNSSSIQVVDLDQDGRLDIVHTCGDTMDAMLPKPYHGLRWIRNVGNGVWENRELGLLVGALESAVADFDGDGDLDIAAVGLFPKAHLDGPGAYDSICWWEQKEQLEFVRHSIERDNCMHTSCTTADVNADGRIDLIVGEWLTEERSAFRVFLNLPADEGTP